MQLDPNRPRSFRLHGASAGALGSATADTDSAGAVAPDEAAALGWLAQLRRLRPLLLAVCAAVLAVVALITWLTLMKESVAITAVFSDASDATGSRLVGLASTLGVLLWAAALMACVLGIGTLRALGAGTARVRSFLVASAAILLMLMLDDFLVVHELGIDFLVRLTDVAYTTAARDLTEMAFFLVYALVVGLYLWRFRSFVRKTEYGLLALGGALLGLSLILDMARIDGAVGAVVTEEHVHSVAIWLEEVPKLLGIAVLALYFARVVVRQIAAVMQRQRQAPAAPG